MVFFEVHRDLSMPAGKAAEQRQAALGKPLGASEELKVSRGIGIVSLISAWNIPNCDDL